MKYINKKNLIIAISIALVLLTAGGTILAYGLRNRTISNGPSPTDTRLENTELVPIDEKEENKLPEANKLEIPEVTEEAKKETANAEEKKEASPKTEEGKKKTPVEEPKAAEDTQKTQPQKLITEEIEIASAGSEAKKDAAPAVTKKTEPKAPVAKAVEAKPAETKAPETKPAETEPAQTQAVETEPPVTEPPVTEPAETEPPETEPAETEPPKPERHEPKAYDFTVYDEKGNPVKLSDYFGKPIVLNFWASWCGPCKREMPAFNQKHLEQGGEVQFLMVNLTGYDTLPDAKAVVEENGYVFPVFYDLRSEAAAAYAVQSFPTTYFIDAEGYLIAKAVGAISAETLQSGIDMIK